MMKIALTGSIGMGKSTVAAMFAEAGIPVFDADAEVRRMQGYGGILVEDIERRFPGTAVGGAIDRDRLSARVVADRDELAALEMIVHPAVARAREAFIEQNRGAIGKVTGLATSVVKAEQDDWDGRVVFGSVQTLARVNRRARMSGVSHLVIDE